MLMVDLQGIWEWWHFKEKGDLDPLLKIMESGALAPVVQRMMANDMRQEEPKAHYLAVKHRRCQYGRAGRLFEAGKQINEWTQEYNKQDAAIAQALEAGLISNVTQGKEAVEIYRNEMARRAREDWNEDE
jgi:hypothetical protein